MTKPKTDTDEINALRLIRGRALSLGGWDIAKIQNLAYYRG